MSLGLYNNLYSLSAQSNLSTANNRLSKSIERLSSGLRINHASDDASGLAIADKLRSQIKGMKRAELNTQDGISYLQCAEGGLEVIENMLHRMRELAVQAGNGTYTSNDRSELQKEIEQLKDEINRISATTEFNTKKLLNGDATAIWSSDKDYINAFVRGQVREANYKLDFASKAGKNEVYKTDIMGLKDGVMAAQIAGSNDTNVAKITGVNNIDKSGENGLYHVQIDADNDVSASVSIIDEYKKDNSSWEISASVTASSFDGYVEVRFVEVNSAAGTFDNVVAQYRIIDAKTGDIGDWFDVTADNTGKLEITGDADMSLTFVADPQSVVNIGDKMLIAVNRETAGADLSAADGKGVIKISGGPENKDKIIISYDEPEELTKADNRDSIKDYNEVQVFIPKFAAGGNLVVGSMTFNFLEGVTFAGDFDVQIQGAGEPASDSTELKNISRFINADGKNILDVTQELTIYGNDKSAVVYIEGSDTIADLENKLTDAIISLGMGANSGNVISSAVNSVNRNLVNYVAPKAETAASNEAVPGTFVIQTALLGNDSKLYFSGSEELLNALSLVSIQEAKNSETTVTVTDAHSGDFIGRTTTSEGLISGVIEGVEVKFSNNMGSYLSWNDSKKSMEYASKTSGDTAFLHIVDNCSSLQIGANKGQDMDVSVPQTDTASLGINDVYVLNTYLAGRAITKLDNAISMVSSARATIGAQVNRLEFTMNNLSIARQNMIQSESRIRDLDVASASADFSRDQLLVNSSIAMLAQANQLPNMILQLIGR